MPLNIFLTGSTGYIGGSVLNLLLSHPLYNTFQITVVIRDPAKENKFRSLGVKTALGSNSDHSLLQHLAYEADVVIACADADDVGAAKAILSGLKRRFERTGVAPSLIHTSGTGVLIDYAKGMHSTTDIYSDLDIDKIETLAPSQLHRPVDLAIVEADTQGYVKTYIILPGTIWGIASGRLVDLGLQNAHSQQVPALVKVGIERGQGGVVGLGKNVWPYVHISDTADLYVLLLEKIHSGEPLAHGRNGFYFGEDGEYVLYDLAKAVSEALYSKGKSKSPTPTTLTEDEVEKYSPSTLINSSNSRCKAERSRAIGWNPKNGGLELFLASVKDEVPS